jgi:hypothetical protein
MKVYVIFQKTKDDWTDEWEWNISSIHLDQENAQRIIHDLDPNEYTLEVWPVIT